MHLLLFLSPDWLTFLSRDYLSYINSLFFIYFLFLSDEGPMLETLVHVSTPTFLYFDIYTVYIDIGIDK